MFASDKNTMSASSPTSSYNSSYGSNSSQKLLNCSNSSINSQVPGGVVTTQNMSTVIRPKSNNNSLQFVKIQPPDLSKKAVEQIRIVQESKVSKDTIKEVEEEWQNNLLQWKSKRRQQFTQINYDQEPCELTHLNENNLNNRKIKTFAEMMQQRAKSGNRLGFNLQRYMDTGDDGDLANTDSDNRQIFDNDNAHSQVDNEKMRYHSHQINVQNDVADHIKTGLDSDSEIHSSTSSGFNLDSKSPSSPETPLSNLDINQNSHIQKLIDHDMTGNNCHSILTDQDNSHTVSLVENGHSNQINSTLIKELKSPLANMKNCSLLDLDMNNREISTKCDESINSASDEDNEDDEDQDEEEELEQRHLQRIAFEAKLKAFENLTKPSKKPGTSSPHLSSNLRSHNSTSQYPKDCRDRNHQDLETSMPRNRTTTENEKPRDRFPKELETSSPRHLSSVDHDKPLDQILKDQETSIARHMTSIDHDKPQDQIPRELETTTSRHRTGIDIESPREQIPQDVEPSIPRYQTSFDNDEPRGQSPQDLELSIPRHRNSIIHDKPREQSPQDLELSIPKYRNSISHDKPQEQIPRDLEPSIPRHRTSNSHYKPREPYHSMSIRHDDKDKTVLSVSGKKRCSSCKEELGRGAAAFVVESLSLVYHTNCFRCSVCHVNLSNGFRGVDVRVHAGALHCQNCYSKDGLNYSRV